MLLGTNTKLHRLISGHRRKIHHRVDHLQRGEAIRKSRPSLRYVHRTPGITLLRLPVRTECEVLQSQQLLAGDQWNRYKTFIAEQYRCNKCLPFVLRIFMEKDRKSTRLNSSHVKISYAVFCLKKKKKKNNKQKSNEMK